MPQNKGDAVPARAAPATAAEPVPVSGKAGITIAPGTPLPWELFKGGERRYPGIEANSSSIVVFGDEGAFEGVRGETEEIAAANARYIVHACNAHGALVEALQGMVDANGPGNTSKARHAAFLAAKAALTLALGEQS